MKFRVFGNLSEIGRVSRQFAVDAIMSPLRKYVVYSVIFHVVLIGALSIHMMLPAKPKEAAKTDGAKSAPADGAAAPAAKDGGKESAKSGADKSAVERAGIEKKPAKSAKPGETPKSTAAPTKATGDKDDYYKRQGIDNTPAKQDEIPKNPFDAKDEMKTLNDLK